MQHLDMHGVQHPLHPADLESLLTFIHHKMAGTTPPPRGYPAPAQHPGGLHPAEIIAQIFHSLSQASHRANIEDQAQFLGKDLRGQGFDQGTAWDFAHQYAKDYDVNNTNEEYAAVGPARQALQTQLHQHQYP